MISLAHGLTNFVPTIKKELIWDNVYFKKSTNHNLFGLWANELFAHFQKTWLIFLKKKSWQKNCKSILDHLIIFKFENKQNGNREMKCIPLIL
jgi:hypothetical protein